MNGKSTSDASGGQSTLWTETARAVLTTLGVLSGKADALIANSKLIWETLREPPVRVTGFALAPSARLSAAVGLSTQKGMSFGSDLKKAYQAPIPDYLEVWCHQAWGVLEFRRSKDKCSPSVWIPISSGELQWYRTESKK